MFLAFLIALFVLSTIGLILFHIKSPYAYYVVAGDVNKYPEIKGKRLGMSFSFDYDEYKLNKENVVWGIVSGNSMIPRKIANNDIIAVSKDCGKSSGEVVMVKDLSEGFLKFKLREIDEINDDTFSSYTYDTSGDKIKAEKNSTDDIIGKVFYSISS